MQKFGKNFIPATGRSISTINAYWARLLLTGRATPPEIVVDSMQMLETIKNNSESIGYMNFNDMTNDVTVVYRMK